MNHSKKKHSGSHEVTKKGPPLGLVIALSVAGGAVLGSAVTYSLSKPAPALEQSAVGATPQAQPLSMPTMPTLPQQQFTPAPQPPGEVPPGKVWSAEHGHWHDVPAAQAIPASATATPLPAVVPPK
jgi:hypothetical protein